MRDCANCFHRKPVLKEDGTWTAECEKWDCEFLNRSEMIKDGFTIEELKSWLYENAMNNFGTEYEKSVIEIINRLDGFARFCKDRRENK